MRDRERDRGGCISDEEGVRAGSARVDSQGLGNNVDKVEAAGSYLDRKTPCDWGVMVDALKRCLREE